MKKISIALAFMVSGFCFSQDTIQKQPLQTKIFSFSPISKKVANVNGLVFGIGLDFMDSSVERKINGINFEANPLLPLIFMFAEPDRHGFSQGADVVINGFDFSTGRIGTENSVQVNGLNISGLNIGYCFNGFSAAGSYTYSTKLNGLHIAGIATTSEEMKGASIALFNTTDYGYGLQIGGGNFCEEKLVGLQIGILNQAHTKIGLQIGLINIAQKNKGLQVGLWNINNKRSMPFINW